MATQSAFGLSSANSIVSTNNVDTTAIIKTPRQTPTSLSSQSETISTTAQKNQGMATTTPSTTKIPKADTRSTSYGYGVPLRPLYATASTQQNTVVCKSHNMSKRVDGGPQFRKQKTTPAWQALPKRDSTRHAADKVELRRRQNPRTYINHPCHCD